MVKGIASVAYNPGEIMQGEEPDEEQYSNLADIRGPMRNKEISHHVHTDLEEQNSKSHITYS